MAGERRRHPILRGAGMTLIGLIVAFVLLLMFLATPIGRNLVAGMVERAASSDELIVRLEDTSGWIPFHFGLGRVSIADRSGPFAEIDNLDIDLAVSALLRGSLALESLTAERVSVERRPEFSDSGSSSSGGGMIPFAIRRFSVDALSLGEALAGRPAVLSLSGTAAAEADGGFNAALQARRTDGVEGTVTAEARREEAGAPVAANIDLAEATDGILAGLLGRSAGPAYRLSARAVPEGTATRGTLSLASTGSAELAGEFLYAPSTESQRLAARLRGDLAELVPEAYAALLSGPIDVNIDADWSGTEESPLSRIAIRQGSFSTASIRGSASGTVDAASADLDLSLDIADPGGEAIVLPAVSARFDTVSLRGKAAPANGIVRLDLTGNIAGLQTDEVTIPGLGISLALESDPGGPVMGGKLPYALRLEADEIRTPNGSMAASDTAPLLLTAAGTFDSAAMSADTRTDLTFAGGRIGFDGALGSEITGRAAVSIDDAGPLGLLAGRALSGGLAGSADGTFTGADGTSLATTVTLRDFDPGIGAAAGLLRGTTRLSANVARTAEAISISDLALEGDVVHGSGAAELRGDAIEANFEGNVSDISSLAPGNEGAAEVSASASGTMTRPDVELEIQLPEGRLANQPVRDALARLRGAPTEDGGWSGDVELSGGLSGGSLSGRADLAMAAGSNALSAPSIDFTVGDNRISGALERDAAGILTGAIDLAAPELNALAALALLDLNGAAQGQARFSSEAGRQRIDVSINGSDLAYQTVRIGRVNGSARVEDAFGTPLVTGNLDGNSLVAGGVRLNTINAAASVEGGGTAFRVGGRGPDIDFAGNGRLAAEGSANVLHLDAFRGTAFRAPVNLEAPVAIRLEGGRTTIPETRIGIGGGAVAIGGSVSDRLALDLAIRNVAASIVNGVAPTVGAQGTISGRANITGATSAPAVDWQADWNGLSVAATRSAGLPALSLSVRGQATTTRTTLDGNLSGAGLALALNGQVPFAGSGLALSVRGTAPLSLLAIQSQRELRLAGTARVDVNVSGSTSAPQIAGTVDLADATVIDADSGFGITGGTGRISFNGQQATISGFNGRLAQGGQINASGTVGIGGGMPADLAIRIANGRYADGKVINATFDADLRVAGALLNGALASGTVTLGRTEVQLPSRMAGSANAIPVEHVNAGPGFRPPQLGQDQAASSAGGGSGNLRLDIQVNNRSGIFVRGFGVDAEFGGSLRITNTAAAPIAAGAFEMRRGRMEVIGRRFEFTRGLMTFSGDLVPVVDFSASTTVTGATAIVSVTGRADDPVIQFSSSPELPEEEILSRLLFGRSVSSLSPLQAAQLLDAAAQLSSGSGQGIFSRIRNATGLDDLDIREGASGGTTVGIGKRINDNLRLGVEAGTGGADSRVTIDLDITRNLKARGATGSSGSGELGLTYEREY